MRFVIATIMMFLFLSSSREFVELSKLPLLIEHYKKHKMENGSLTLIDFLKIHYTKETQSDNDDTEDSRLPFKTIFDNHLSQLYLPVSVAPLASNHLPVIFRRLIRNMQIGNPATSSLRYFILRAFHNSLLFPYRKFFSQSS